MYRIRNFKYENELSIKSYINRKFKVNNKKTFTFNFVYLKKSNEKI